MNKAVTWNINGVGFDAREAAREAARRQGMSLGEWLDGVIADHAADLGVEEEDFDGQERIDAVTAKLERLGSSPTPAPGRPRDRARRDDRRPAPRHDETERLLDDAIQAMDRRALRTERKTERALASFAKIIESTESKRDDERDMFSALSRKLSDMETRIASRVTDDNPIRGTLARLEARLESLARTPVVAAPAPEPRRTDEPFQRLESKLNSLLDAVSKKPAAEPMQTSALATSAARAPAEPVVAAPAFANRRLGEAIADIAKHQRALERNAPARRPAEPPVARSTPDTFSHLQSEIGTLGVKIEDMRRAMVRDGLARSRDGAAAQIDDLRAEVATMSRTLREQAPRDTLPGQIAQMTDALEDMRRDIARRDDERRRSEAKLTEVASRADLDGLKAEIGGISRTLGQLAPRSTVTALEDAIRTLTARIETSRDSNARETVLRPLEDIVGDLRHSLADIDSRETIGGLERDVRTIGGKLDDLHGVDVSALGRIQSQTQEIRDLLSAAAAHPLSIERIEQQVATLADRMDQQPSLSGQDSQAFHAAAAEIRAMLDNPPGTALFDKIEQRLETLTAKVDQAIVEASDARKVAELSKRHFDSVQETLAARLEAPAPQTADVRSLEGLVRDLAARIEAVRAPDASNQAIEALQEQILRLSTRFERSDGEMSALSSIERSMQDLFTHLEETRASVETTAARAAREATKAALAGGAAIDPATAREIATLKAIQEDADHRTHATLNAVHETLEKVVDRLSLMEHDVRGRPSAMPDAASRDIRADGNKTSQSPARPPLPDLRLDASDALDLPAPSLKTVDRTRTPAFSAQRPAPTDLDETAGRADFIAAARHAARTAQSDPSVLAMKRPEAAASNDVRAGLMARTRDYVSSHKRPVLLSIAALFVLFGTLAVIGQLNPGAGPDRLAKAPSPPPARVAEAAPRRDADKNGRATLADLTPSALPVAPAPSSAALPGSDPITTGSIARLPSFAAQGAAAAAAAAPSGALKQLADEGNASAQYEIASRYADGRLLIKDFAKAATWYEKAAQQGLAPAQYKLASLYEKGLGVARDKAKAKFWYVKAADAGNPRAMHNLAVLVADGEGKPDYASAVTWFRKAAEYGVHDSQYNLGILLARGLGTPQSLVQSYQWFAVAAQQNDADAATKRDDVAAKLTPNDLAVAKALAAAFHPKTADFAATEIETPAGGWDGASSPSLVKSARPKLSSL